MVKIRLTRTGKRNQAYFRLGVYDARTRRDGRSIEMLGFYNPHATDAASKTKFDLERVKYWLSVGAQPTEKVEVLLNEAGVQTAKPKKKKPAAAAAAGKKTAAEGKPAKK